MHLFDNTLVQLEYIVGCFLHRADRHLRPVLILSLPSVSRALQKSSPPHRGSRCPSIRCGPDMRQRKNNRVRHPPCPGYRNPLPPPLLHIHNKIRGTTKFTQPPESTISAAE